MRVFFARLSLKMIYHLLRGSICDYNEANGQYGEKKVRKL